MTLASLLNPAGQYVTPTTPALTAAAAAMSVDPKQSQVVAFDVSSSAAKAATAAYPLSMPVYAAANPAMSDATVRADYANFITVAASTGQVSGTGDGELPDGYAPIPAAWRTQALAAAATIKSGPSASASPTATPTATATAGSTNTTSTTTTAAATTAAVDQTAAAQPSAAVATDPAATGATAKSLSSGKTASDPNVGAMAAVVPVSATAALIAALAIPPLTRRKRL